MITGVVGVDFGEGFCYCREVHRCVEAYVAASEVKRTGQVKLRDVEDADTDRLGNLPLAIYS